MLGSPAGDLLQPSDAGDSAMIPLDDVSTDKIAFWLLDYDEESNRYLYFIKLHVEVTHRELLR